MSKANIAVVIPNWNGRESIGAALNSLRTQTLSLHVIVVDNGSTDDSLEFIQANYPEVEVLKNKKNLGFAAGVNTGIRELLSREYTYVALLNDDAVVHSDWLKELVGFLNKSPGYGIAACKLMDAHGTHFDSTGEVYTNWGLPYPRGRGEMTSSKYDHLPDIFAASGGASLYRLEMLKQIGLFDEDFFAYYEDVDISFRAQLAGWKVAYVPQAMAYHQIGATSSKIKGFTTYQTIKNLPLLFWKNVPRQLMPTILPRFALAHTSFIISALARLQLWPVAKGCLASIWLLPKKLPTRIHIQKGKTVTTDYLRSMLVWDLPPGALRLRKLRHTWRKIT